MMVKDAKGSIQQRVLVLAFYFFALLTIVGCKDLVTPTVKIVTGQYQLKSIHGISRLELCADGSFQHEFEGVDGFKYAGAGTWRLEPPARDGDQRLFLNSGKFIGLVWHLDKKPNFQRAERVISDMEVLTPEAYQDGNVELRYGGDAGLRFKKIN